MRAWISWTVSSQKQRRHERSAKIEIGEIAEVILGDEGRVSTIIVNDGGYFGLAGNEVALNFDDMAKVIRRRDDLDAHLVLSDASLENHKEYDAGNLPAGHKQVSALFGTDVDIEGTDRDAEIHDVIFSPDGTATHVVLEFGGILDVGDKRVLTEYGNLHASADDGEKYTASISEETILASEHFYYTLAEIQFTDHNDQ